MFIFKLKKYLYFYFVLFKILLINNSLENNLSNINYDEVIGEEKYCPLKTIFEYYNQKNNINIKDKNNNKNTDVEYKIYYKGCFYRDEDDPEGKKCPISWKWVNNKEESDIIAIDFLDNIDKNIFGYDMNNYEYDKNRQKLLLLNMESPVKFSFLNEQKNFFDYIIDFRLDSDVPMPYTSIYTSDSIIKLSKPLNFSKPALPTKQKKEYNRGLAVAFISSTYRMNGSLEYLKELMKYIKIDSYGKYLHNKDPNPEDIGKDSIETKMNVIRKYKFTLAFENSNYHDYVTEKFFQPLVEGSIPVYLGTSNILDFAPDDHSYIDVNKFENPKELAEYLKYLDQNDEEYEKYLEWKKKAIIGDLGENLNRLVEIGKYNRICKLLQRINNMWINPYLTIWDRKDVPKNERACILC